MFGLFQGYNRRQLKAVRRDVRAVTSVVDQDFRGNPPEDLIWALESMSSGLIQFEQEIGATADIVFLTNQLRTWSMELRKGVGRVERWRKSRRFSWERSPLKRVFDALDRLDDSINGLYGPPTEFQRLLRKLIEKSGASVYGLAKSASVDETYIRRWLSGERRRPSRRVAVNLAIGLTEYSAKISSRDAVRLIRAAGYEPPTEA